MPRASTTAPIVAIAATAASLGCSLLAPSDEELMPEPTSSTGASSSSSSGGSDGGSGGVGGSGGSLAGGGGVGGLGDGFCGQRMLDDPTVRFCEDFDDADSALSPQTWGTPGGPQGSAVLVREPYGTAPFAAQVVLERRPGCYYGMLAQEVFGTTTSRQAPPHLLRLHMALATTEDGYFGQMTLAGCTAIVTVQSAGDTVGFEFQWSDGAAHVDYPVATSVFGRVPSVQWDIDLEAGTTAVAVDGEQLSPESAFEVPTQCRTPVVPMVFAVGLVCNDTATVVVDDVVFGTN